MSAPSAVGLVLMAELLMGQLRLVAQESRHTLPDEPSAAWAEVEQMHQALRPPRDWQSHPPTTEQLAAFQIPIRQAAASFADKAVEFIARFPTNENVGDARVTV